MKKLLKKSSSKYWSIEPILTKNCIYNIVFGERSNGKSYAVLDYILSRYCKGQGAGAIIRRYDEDLRASNGVKTWISLVVNDVAGNKIEYYTKGVYNHFKYKSRAWYLVHIDEDGKIDKEDENPFCFALALTMSEHYKSTNFPSVTSILFDEFITRDQYLINEFVIFMNTLSTIIRDRDNVKIFMCGNTVNKYCPYFNEMGLYRVREMKQGEIDVYKYGEKSETSVAIEYSDSPSKQKKSDIYFAFKNPKLQMITKGEWEIGIYPHRPVPFTPYDVIYIYFIVFEEDVLQCEIVQKDDLIFTYIHRKTTPIKEEKKNLVYQQEYDVRPNYKRKITKPTTTLEKNIASFYVKDKVFYQDNEVGEIVRNYLLWCNNQSITNG